jgi:D-arabinose 1-dehydrogenase-like Zn-dependent alcohol dehydrogenase
VDAIGEGVAKFNAGDRVAVLTDYGGCSEMIYLGEKHLAPVPQVLNPAEVVTMVLNYVTAYQMLYRVAKIKEGDKVYQWRKRRHWDCFAATWKTGWFENVWTASQAITTVKLTILHRDFHV